MRSFDTADAVRRLRDAGGGYEIVHESPGLELGVYVLVAPEADPGQQLVEQLARLADEGLALLVLVESRRLADEHQIGARVADAEDDLGPALREPALRAAGAFGREGV